MCVCMFVYVCFILPALITSNKHGMGNELHIYAADIIVFLSSSGFLSILWHLLYYLLTISWTSFLLLFMYFYNVMGDDGNTYTVFLM